MSQCVPSRHDAADLDASPTGIGDTELNDSRSNSQLMWSEKLHEPPPIWGSDERPTYGRRSWPSWCRAAPPLIVGSRPIPSVQRKHPGGIWRWHRWRRRGVTVDVLEMLQKDDHRSQREAVRVMVILNLTSGGSQELVAELCRLGAAKPRCDLLAAGGADLIMVFMDAPSNVLRCAEQVDREGTVALQVDECGGLDRIGSLQTYEEEPSSSSAGTSTMTTGRTLRWRRPPPPPMASS
ncbi:Importin subunit alpha-1 [Amphibalanus amphitrite]|uniref:Importin subunit alpha-1 n=1 Tax=Amphibalanus amphitrite TaxID=1232801 RepID=A0A6A4VKG8_AMPAM|nr:Importin subunit alpha-1 [Amphibalanus amphitrite]